MSFIHPALLFGILAVSVPIIIHLLNRRKFQRVVWAAMRFLRVSVEQNQRRMRVEDLILLALRCLLVALLALALARPALRSAAGGLLGARVTGLLLLDNSYSLSHSDGVASRFDKARQAAEQVVNAAPVGSALAVHLVSDTVNAIVPEPTHDMNLVRKVIREARLSDRASDLLPVLKQSVDTLRRARGMRKEIYLVTDTQALGWRQLGEINKLLISARQEQIKVHLIMVGEPAPQNLGVSRLRLASGLTPINESLRFEAQVSNYGREEVRSVKVNLSVNGDPPMDETVIDVLPGGAAKSVSLFAKLRGEGFHSVAVRLPPDRLPADDRRSLALRAVKEVRVLLVDGDPGREPRESQVFFLRHALQPVPLAEASQYFVKTTIITTPDLPGARLDDYEAVILANVSEFPEASLAGLQQYLRRGGGLMIFPGPLTLATSYNELLGKKAGLLPATLGAVRGQAESEDQFFTLQEKDYTHPLVEIWNDPGAGTLGSARFFRFFALQPVPWKPSAEPPENQARNGAPGEAGEPRVVLKYSDGSPAVMERAWGLGRVILFSSTANTAWNDLPVRPAFVPLVHRALGALAQRQDEGLNVRVGDRFIYRLANEHLGKDVVIRHPGEPTTAQRDLRRVELVSGTPTLRFEGTDHSGVYEASIAGDAARTIKFAAQPDAAESDLADLSADQFKMLESAAQLIRWKPGVSMREWVERERVGTELWLPLLLAVVLLAVTETILAQWFSRTK